jgi:hypothetical protein
MARKTAEPALHAAASIWGSHTLLEGSFTDIDPGAALNEKIMLLVSSLTNEFMLGLDLLRAYDASMDLRRKSLLITEEDVSPRGLGTGNRASSLVMTKDQVIPAQC